MSHITRTLTVLTAVVAFAAIDSAQQPVDAQADAAPQTRIQTAAVPAVDSSSSEATFSVQSAAPTQPKAKAQPRAVAHVGAPGTVAFPGYPTGTIVVRTGQRRLYLVVSEGRAITYPVGVGRASQQWVGTSQISGKYIKPAWTPPDIIRKAQPKLPKVIEGGSPKNPMGAAALTLSGGEYAIHGTNAPGSIGGFVSYGCIRMHNAHIMDLYARVSVGTPVVVTR